MILDVVDQNRVLADSPVIGGSKWTGVPRHVMSLKDLEPTPVTVTVQRGARVGTLTKVCRRAQQGGDAHTHTHTHARTHAQALEAQGTVATWAASPWAKKIDTRAARVNITDFDRVALDRARRQRNYALRKSVCVARTVC